MEQIDDGWDQSPGGGAGADPAFQKKGGGGSKHCVHAQDGMRRVHS